MNKILKFYNKYWIHSMVKLLIIALKICYIVVNMINIITYLTFACLQSYDFLCGSQFILILQLTNSKNIFK